MLSYREVARYLRWRVWQMREDARKTRLIMGPAAVMFAVALESAAASLEHAAEDVERTGKGEPSSGHPGPPSRAMPEELETLDLKRLKLR